ncbi:MAG: ImmA/IrrE family metallo-endopeptidase [Candidatus Berkelbacteria bacterium]|nr:ImmA/IrrE family metallo-endopeptidase [Candidatus Berkelbacteria bacterium]
MAINYLDEARQLSESKRKELGLDDAPIKNLFALLEGQGIFVVKMPVDSEEFSGVFFYDREKNLSSILVNSNRSIGHQNFTAVHEYCHHLRDKETQPLLIEFNGGSKPTYEKLADCFAANFLMPGNGVKTYIKEVLDNKSNKLTDEELVRIRNEFDVSWQATIYQLNNLKYGFDKDYKIKLLETSRLNFLSLKLGYEPQKTVEHGELKLPSEYLKLAFNAYFTEMITLDKLAELLRKSYEETKDLVAEIRRAGDEKYRE